jgi:hypothetical protein
MEFDYLADINADLQQRLSSWRDLPDVVEHPPKLAGESSANIEEVRVRQRRIGRMCLDTLKAHDAFIADMKAYVEHGDRDPHHQQRVEDEAAFALGVFEQTSALALEQGIKGELAGLPKEVIQTVYVQPPPPPKSWFRRVIGI